MYDLHPILSQGKGKDIGEVIFIIVKKTFLAALFSLCDFA
jgi:hypothetical protein